MKRSIACLLLGIALLCGCSEGLKTMEANYAIKITGSDKLQFSGYYSIIGTGGISKPVNVEGTVPAEYKGTGFAALCVFRKKSAEGTLKVEVLKDNKTEALTETSQPYGVISAGKMPDQDSIINRILGKILG